MIERFDTERGRHYYSKRTGALALLPAKRGGLALSRLLCLVAFPAQPAVLRVEITCPLLQAVHLRLHRLDAGLKHVDALRLCENDGDQRVGIVPKVLQRRLQVGMVRGVSHAL